MHLKNRSSSEYEDAQSTTPSGTHRWIGTKLSLWLSVLVALVLIGWLAIPPVSGSSRLQSNVVQVSLVDGHIDMPETLPAGPTTFEVTNNGTTEHNFEIGGPAMELKLESNLSPGQSGTLDVDLAPGEYQVFCPVD